ncbi:hypothetical protein J2X08_004276 [Rhizobium rosettiformans]|nr:hypothetical protein [Rhizobium rosettiformans]MDR7066750.1 hypothetical protein [Rhizobium rosettiformans]
MATKRKFKSDAFEAIELMGWMPPPAGVGV